MDTGRALLLIADIGGYTEYMHAHRTVLGHAEAATRRMLEKVVDAARGVHDPAVAKENGVFWLFSTGRGIPAGSSTMTDAAAYDGYKVHPAHVAAANHVRSVVKSRVCMDYEF